MSPAASLAQGGMQSSETVTVQTNKSKVHAKSKTSARIAGTRSLARADVAAGTHGTKGRANARLHGSHRTNFCPPGQAKKPGLGSRFQC
jgi:hypothetical protein